MDSHFTESVVEDAALDILSGLGYAIAHGPDIAPGEPAAERTDYGDVVWIGRLRDALLLKLMSGEAKVKDAKKFMEQEL